MINNEDIKNIAKAKEYLPEDVDTGIKKTFEKIIVICEKIALQDEFLEKAKPVDEKLIAFDKKD